MYGPVCWYTFWLPLSCLRHNSMLQDRKDEGSHINAHRRSQIKTHKNTQLCRVWISERVRHSLKIWAFAFNDDSVLLIIVASFQFEIGSHNYSSLRTTSPSCHEGVWIFFLAVFLQLLSCALSYQATSVFNKGATLTPKLREYFWLVLIFLSFSPYCKLQIKARPSKQGLIQAKYPQQRGFRKLIKPAIDCSYKRALY